MPEGVENIFYLLLALVFWLGPALLKLLRRRSASRPQPQPQPPPQRPEPAQRTAAAPEPRPEPEPEPVLEPLPEPAAPVSRIEALRRRTAAVEGLASELRRRALLHGGATERLMPTILSRGIEPAAELTRRLEAGSALDWDDLLRIENQLGRLEEDVERIQRALEQRTGAVNSDLLELLDLVAQDCLNPYSIHARRLEIAEIPTRAAVLITPAESAPESIDPSLATVAIEERELDAAGSWTRIAGRVARAVLQARPEAIRELRAASGLPDPASADALFSSTGRLTVSALAAAWLPVLAADALATVQLGEAYAAGLQPPVGRSRERDEASRIAIGSRLGSAAPPLHVRMYIVCRSLESTGLAEEAAQRWERWVSSLDDAERMEIAGHGFSPIPLDADRVLSAVAPIVEAVFDHPVRALGHYPPARIVGLALGSNEAERMRESAMILAEGRAVPADPRIAIGAAALAVESSSSLESRVRGAALRSLEGEDLDDPSARAEQHAALGDFASLRRGGGETFARAVTLAAALAPMRGGRRPL
ncbi:MAG: hypothetical protein R6V85_20925 [Polyangia bacterium]